MYVCASQFDAFLRLQHTESCDRCTLIGSADIPVGATERCPESQTLFPRAGNVIHPVLRNRGLVYETNEHAYTRVFELT